ncbi:unnamed protein product [Blepharisma stoltei]|uniref:C2H2-type domain-containing protein n=1 Tax=Blepharisma stoltei TaxID=1481888 RepID=A0AAU9IWN6_9CILI|nr:unnamed protein product [Blepharisma stoltei]
MEPIIINMIASNELPHPRCLNTECILLKYKCNQCSHCFSSLEDLSTHQIVTSKVIQIPKQTDLEEYSDDKTYYKSLQYTFNCATCLKSFDSEKGLRQHVGKKHPRKSKNMVCETCGKGFYHKYALEFHIKQVHDKVTRSECKNCGKTFYNKYILIKHMNKCGTSNNQL